MIILLTRGDLVDFKSPIFMNPDQRSKFIDFFNDNFEDVDVVDVEEFEPEYKERGSKESRKWTDDELLELFSSLDNLILSLKLKRSEMSVLMMRSDFVPKYYKWAASRGLVGKPDINFIKDFLKEHGDVL